MALSFGPVEVVAARKWKQESKETNAQSYIFPKTTLFILLGILVVLLVFSVRFLWYKQQATP
jgi:hypothetical protein